MRAAVMRNQRLVTADLPRPEPGPGEVLVKTLACGICGSDLHALRHAEQFVAASRRAGSVFTMDLSRDVVMGHEFCAEIVEHGPATTGALRAGTRVCQRSGGSLTCASASMIGTSMSNRSEKWVFMTWA